MIEGKELALAACAFADDKQAEDIVVLDLHGISTISDYFVICSGTSLPHLRAIRKEVVGKMAEKFGVSERSIDGDAESQWLVIDYGDVIVHVFHRDKRPYYALEELWSDAPRVEWHPVGTAGRD